MPLEALDSRRLYAQIADQVAGMIATGEYRPGEQLLSERDLAERLGVSRPTVREAMIALEVRGLIDIRVGVGIFVRAGPAQPTPDSAVPDSGPAGDRRLPEDTRQKVPRHTALEVIEARLLVEPQVAALAAERLSADDLSLLRGHLRQLGEAFDRGQWSNPADRAIHETIARASGNQVLADLVHALFDDRDEAVALKFDEHLAQMPQVRASSFDDHRLIVEALGRRDPGAARKAMQDHLAAVQRAMLAGWSAESG